MIQFPLAEVSSFVHCEAVSVSLPQLTYHYARDKM